MAEPLANLRNSSDVTQAVSLGFHDQYDDADRAVADAVAERKDLRKKIKASGINMKGFDRARADRVRSGSDREAEDFEYRRQMAWMSKPVGFQATMDDVVDEGLAALNVHELHRVDNDGFDAGKNGHKRGNNPWTPGTEAFQRWDSAWVRGQAEIASTLSGKAPNGAGTATAADAATAPKRGRGRPPKARQPTHEAPGGEQ
jgi:hypothetical protein